LYKAILKEGLMDGPLLVLWELVVMIKKAFLLGRPGSGKSSVAQLIEMFAKDRDWITHYINDYQLLLTMFLQEQYDSANSLKNFRQTGTKEQQGFDVIDFSVLDEVLEMMACKVKRWKEEQKNLEKNELFLIEFARGNYSQALHHFSCDILQNAHLLYLNVDVECCIERNHKRTDHFVSDEIMRTYYYTDDWSRIMYDLQDDCEKFVIKNTGTFQDLQQKVEEWVDIHLKPKVVVADSYAAVG
jgi:gluconate kinase